MRVTKGVILLAGLFVFSGVCLLFVSWASDPQAQAQLEKPCMWGGDTLVHQGDVSRYLRNGYSSDYDENTDALFAAVAGYSSAPDTVYCYSSGDGGLTWNLLSSLYSETGGDLSNPQVISGEGGAPYQFFSCWTRQQDW